VGETVGAALWLLESTPADVLGLNAGSIPASATLSDRRDRTVSVGHLDFGICRKRIAGVQEHAMPRSRNIKPAFFKNEELAECDPLARMLFQALWCEADRDGRLEDRPKRLKAEYLPYDDVDVDDFLWQLADRGFIKRYVVDGANFIWIPNFGKHQSPHKQEESRNYPAYSGQVRNRNGTNSEPTPKCIEDSSNRISLIADCGLLIAERGNLKDDARKSPPARRAAFAATDVEIPSDFDVPEVRQALDDWLAHKKAMKKAYQSADNVARLFKKFKTAAEFVEAVDHSIACNYQGLYGPKQNAPPPVETPQTCQMLTEEEMKTWSAYQ
jgi:hypothetical protein